jgi:hypothetical protein
MAVSVSAVASPTCCPNVDDSSMVTIFVTMLLIGWGCDV